MVHEAENVIAERLVVLSERERYLPSKSARRKQKPCLSDRAGEEVTLLHHSKGPEHRTGPICPESPVCLLLPIQLALTHSNRPSRRYLASMTVAQQAAFRVPTEAET